MLTHSDPKTNRHKQVILLVDNRKANQAPSKANLVDFRNSAFKQTEIDPLEPRPDIAYLNEEDTIIKELKKKISDLEKRVQSLEKQNNPEMGNSKSGEGSKKKKRRRFDQLNRDFKCSHEECGKNYGSETSLKNHIKLKHRSQKAQN